MAKSSFKRKLYLTLAASSFLFRNWTVRKKLHIGFLSLILVLTLNVIVTTYEISRLKEAGTKLSYLVYLDIMGIVTGCLFIWIISQSVLRPIKRIIHQLENRASLESLRLYSNDELGQLARAVNYMKKSSFQSKPSLDEKDLLLETILSHSIESIFIFNEEGGFTNYSKGFKTIAKVQQDQKGHLKDVFVNLELEKVFSHLSNEKVKDPFYQQRVFIRTKRGKDYMLNCSICKVSGQSHEMYIGILKEVDRRVKIKESFSRAFKPLILRGKQKN